MRDSTQEYFQKGATGVLPLAEVQGKNLAVQRRKFFRHVSILPLSPVE